MIFNTASLSPTVFPARSAELTSPQGSLRAGVTIEAKANPRVPGEFSAVVLASGVNEPQRTVINNSHNNDIVSRTYDRVASYSEGARLKINTYI